MLAALVAAGPAVGGNGERTYAAEFEQGGSITFRLERGDNPRVRDTGLAASRTGSLGAGLRNF